MKKERQSPHYRSTYTPVDGLWFLLSLSLLVGIWLVYFQLMQQLVDWKPIFFNSPLMPGMPSFSISPTLLFTFPFLATLFSILFGVLGHFPERFNFMFFMSPVNRRFGYILVALMYRMAALCILAFTFIFLSTVDQTASGHIELGLWFLLPLLALIFVPTAFFLTLALQRPRQE